MNNLRKREQPAHVVPSGCPLDELFGLVGTVQDGFFAWLIRPGQVPVQVAFHEIYVACRYHGERMAGRGQVLILPVGERPGSGGKNKGDRP